MTPIRSVGLIANPHKAAARILAQKVLEHVLAHGASACLAPEIAGFLTHPSCAIAQDVSELAGCEVILVLGGDGTLLHAVRALGGNAVPVLGVNVGSLGFLTDAQYTEIDEILPRVLRGEFQVVERPLLAGVIEDRSGRETQGLSALNDIVVDEGSPTRRAVRLKLSLDGETVGTFTGDGLVVATPAGSTAYSLSAGGPILNPGVTALVLTPICPHATSVRPLVYPDTGKLLVEDQRRGLQIKVTADGQVYSPVPEGGRVRVFKRSDARARLVSLARHSYYDILRGKLSWGRSETK